VFQFRKNEYKKTCNILKNGFTESIFKNTKKRSIFLKPKQMHPTCACAFVVVMFWRKILFVD
jgi:hypothetical protein